MFNSTASRMPSPYGKTEEHTVQMSVQPRMPKKVVAYEPSVNRSLKFCMPTHSMSTRGG